jgi:CubicO group peptidase (beta-lactamase class C family)
MKKLWITLLAISLLGCTRFADGPVSKVGTEVGSFDPVVISEVEELFDESGIPSMAAVVVVGDGLLWARGFGVQEDLATVYMAGSIDKPFIATTFLQLVEEGKIGLDDDISNYLPFEVRNPYRPEVVITPRILLSHQSGLVHDVPGLRYVDNDGPMLWWRFWNLDKKFWDLWHAVIPSSDTREEIVASALVDESGGAWAGLPGESYQYSNTGFYDLLGRAIEEIEGKSREVVITERVLEPLGMENSGFDAHAFPKGQLAVPYVRFEEGYEALPATGMSATGRLRTTAIDMARFMTMHMNGGALDGTQILTLESMEQMHACAVEMGGFDFPSMSLSCFGWGWILWGEGLQGHSGAVPGFFAQMVYGDADGIPYGVVLMMNTGCSVVECDFEWFEDYFSTIRTKLLHAAEQIAR